MSRVGIDAFPPAIQLLLRDLRGFEENNPYKRIKEMLPDLRQQATYSLRQYLDKVEQDRPSEAFVWHLPSDLDPLSAGNKCNAPQCRMNTARETAKFIGLYADVAYIPDHISHRIAFTSRWTEHDSIELMFQLMLLCQLAPLVASGILRFSAPVVPSCANCIKELDRRIEVAAAGVLDKHAQDLAIERVGDVINLSPHKFDEFAPWYHHKLSPAERRRLTTKRQAATIEKLGRDAYGRVLRQQAYETFLGASATRWTGAVTVTGSRANALMLRELEGLTADSPGNQEWEVSQSTKLPWIREMSLEQILALRGEAADALPRFRVTMGRVFSNREQSSPGEFRSVVSDLHDEALQVEQEIRNVGIVPEGRFQSLLGSVSIVAAAVGAIADAKAAAVAGLITILSHIHKTAREDHREIQTLKSRPGFVLLKSKEILGHAT